MCLLALPLQGASDVPAKERTRRELIERMAAMLPRVAKINGFDSYKPIPVEVFSRAESQAVLAAMIRSEIPAADLAEMASALAEIGLLPRDYDLADGMSRLLSRYMAAGYDPAGDRFVCLLDVYNADGKGHNYATIMAHELTHALQDQVFDIYADQMRHIGNMDHDFAINALLEGMACLSMMAFSRSAGLEGLPDVSAYMRASFDHNPAFSQNQDIPPFLLNRFRAIYVDGSAFVQQWLKEHPKHSLRHILRHTDLTSEQVLHYDKFKTRDTPGVTAMPDCAPPKDWEFQYKLYLGEWDVRAMFSRPGMARAHAEAIAAGWDGLVVHLYTTPAGQQVLLGLSCWDREDDAGEFASALPGLLEELHPPGSFNVYAKGKYVAFFVGPRPDIRAPLLQALITRAGAG